MKEQLKIGIVGPCAAGKSTLITSLKAHGILARHIAQEHSFAPAMWQRLTNPDLLIYLHVSYETTLRRQQLDWTPAEYEEQLRRLAHARQHADLCVDTDPLTPAEVLAEVMHFLEEAEKARESFRQPPPIKAITASRK